MCTPLIVVIEPSERRAPEGLHGYHDSTDCAREPPPPSTSDASMSNLERHPNEMPCGGRAVVAADPVRELQRGATVALGGPRAMSVTRTLPNRARRMVGAWCFVDYYGPDDITGYAGMRVPPHPHTGLQTVSWLIAGEVLHRDSVGSLADGQPRAAQPDDRRSRHLPLRGVARATARRSCTACSCGRRCPDGDRHVRPHFEHHADLPELSRHRRRGHRDDGRARRCRVTRGRVHPARRCRGRACDRRRRAAAAAPGVGVRGARPGGRDRRSTACRLPPGRCCTSGPDRWMCRSAPTGRPG